MKEVTVAGDGMTREKIEAVGRYWLDYTVDPADKADTQAIIDLALKGLDAEVFRMAASMAGLEGQNVIDLALVALKEKE